MSSDNDMVRVEHIDSGCITIECRQNIGRMAAQHASIDRQLMYVSLMNVVPPLHRDWTKADVTAVHGFIKKNNANYVLNIRPRWKMCNIILAASIDVASTENESTYSLIEFVLNANAGRVDMGGVHEFIGHLTDWSVIDHTTRAYIVNSSAKAADRALQYAHDIMAKRSKGA